MTEPITGSNLLLENELTALAERLKASGQPEITREHVKELLAEKMALGPISTPASAPAVATAVADAGQTPAPKSAHGELPTAKTDNYLDAMPEESGRIVNELIAGLPELGLAKTISKAQTDSPFVLDALHDSLTTRLYDELKSRQLI